MPAGLTCYVADADTCRWSLRTARVKQHGKTHRSRAREGPHPLELEFIVTEGLGQQ
jgi:hypothetical protein